MGNAINYNRPDGQEVAGYLSAPVQGANAPASVVIQECWGRNDKIRGVQFGFSGRTTMLKLNATALPCLAN